MISDGGGGAEDGGQVEEGEINVIQMVSNMFSTMDSNDLASLKTYLENGDSGIEKYTNAVEYSYSVTPQIYRQDVDGIRQVNPDTSFDALGLGSSSGSNSMMSSIMSTDVFYEMPENAGLYESQYDVKAGRWPENYNECVLVLTSGGGISDFLLYTLGLRDSMELDEMIQQFIDEENIDTPENMGSYSYDDLIGITFKLVNSAEYYEYDSQYQVWRDKTDDEEYMKNLVKNGEDITIVGVVQPSEDANGLLLNTGICYPSSLTEHVAEEAEDSEIVQRQLADKDINVFTGEAFGEQSSNSEFDTNSLFTIDAEKLQNAFTFDSSGLADGLDGAFDLSSLGSLSGGSLNLSEMIDLSDIQLTLPEAPSISMSDIMDNIEITASLEDLGQMVSGLLEGYQEYSAQNPQADYSRLGEYFLQYLQTPEAQKILEDNIRDIIESGADLTVSIEELQQLVRDVMAGYQEYALENGYTDPDRFDEYLVEYLQTPEAQAVLTQWASNAIGDIGDVAITEDQLKKLASELAAGYQSYAAANGLPDPSRMGEYFLDYLGTDDAKQKLAAGIAAMVDTGSLESQISASIQSYMGQVMSSLSGEMVQSLETQITSAMTQVMNQISAGMESAMEQAVTRLGTNMENAMSIDSDAFADAFTMNMSGDELAELMMSMNSTENATYENNLRTLGYVDFDVPSGIDIYPIDFESKEQVVRILDDYNSRMEAEGKDEQVITYTDMVGTLMSSVTDIIDIISYVLIAFVAISLVVSSIMIGVITYISVLERKKEIGILRAIGASKGNISQVFNAETFIIGLCAGLIGIGLSLLLLIPGNALIHYLAGTNDVSAVLPAGPAVVLILLSVVLTLIGGIIPSRKAAKSDPVAALRTE